MNCNNLNLIINYFFLFTIYLKKFFNFIRGIDSRIDPESSISQNHLISAIPGIDTESWYFGPHWSSLLMNFCIALKAACFPYSMNSSRVSVSVYRTGFSFCLCFPFNLCRVFRIASSASAVGCQGWLRYIENMGHTYHLSLHVTS